MENNFRAIRQENAKKAQLAIANKKNAAMNKIAEMMSKGIPISEISKKVGYSTQTVRKWINESGIKMAAVDLDLGAIKINPAARKVYYIPIIVKRILDGSESYYYPRIEGGEIVGTYSINSFQDDAMTSLLEKATGFEEMKQAIEMSIELWGSQEGRKIYIVSVK